MLMSYVPYVTKEYYFDTYGGTIVPEELLERYIRQASRHIDSLTFNRIVSQGIINMTHFSRISSGKWCVCRLNLSIRTKTYLT